MDTLKPPPELNINCDNLSVTYKTWIQRVELYSLASGLSEKSEGVQCAAFLHMAGEGAIKVFNTFEIASSDRNRIEVLKRKFLEYCQPRKNLIYCRYVFFNRSQRESENIDEYVTELKTMAGDCEFEQLYESLIRDRIVCGTRNNNLKTALLRCDNLTLQKCIEMCRAHEMSLVSMKELSLMPIMEEADTLSVQCHVCNRTGHFAKCCRNRSADDNSSDVPRNRKFTKKKQGTVKKVSAESDSESSGEIYSVQSEAGCKKAFDITLKINNANVKCKLDTGSDVNVIGKETLLKIDQNPKLRNSKLRLNVYGNSKIKTVGFIKLKCHYKCKSFEILFHVVDKKVPTLISADTCVELNVIKRIYTVSHNVLNEYSNVFKGQGEVKGFRHQIVVNEEVVPVVDPPRKNTFEN
ncbi:hypothetical protein GQR58_027656 [Nymphon striatum]|nr:hypothetical protein GQR58_027656 [Nymphon striatum]